MFVLTSSTVDEKNKARRDRPQTHNEDFSPRTLRSCFTLKSQFLLGVVNNREVGNLKDEARYVRCLNK